MNILNSRVGKDRKRLDEVRLIPLCKIASTKSWILEGRDERVGGESEKGRQRGHSYVGDHVYEYYSDGKHRFRLYSDSIHIVCSVTLL